MGTLAADSNELAHYGVPGMKWGRRKDRGNSSVDKAPSFKTHEDAAEANRNRAKAKVSTDSLSNAELKKLVERMNMEANYKRLTTQPQQLSFGQKMTKEMLPVIGQELASQYAARQFNPYSEPDRAPVLHNPSGRKMAADILADTGKTVLKKHGLRIGIGLAGAILKAAL